MYHGNTFGATTLKGDLLLFNDIILLELIQAFRKTFSFLWAVLYWGFRNVYISNGQLVLNMSLASSNVGETLKIEHEAVDCLSSWRIGQMKVQLITRLYFPSLLSSLYNFARASTLSSLTSFLNLHCLWISITREMEQKGAKIQNASSLETRA